jgi:hypothetical protein
MSMKKIMLTGASMLGVGSFMASPEQEKRERQQLTTNASRHPEKAKADSRQVRRQKERLAKKTSLVDKRHRGREV